MALYVVTRQGVYRHEVIGVFDDLRVAQEGARKALIKERDSYHEFYVLELSLNESIPLKDGEYEEKVISVIKREEVVHV